MRKLAVILVLVLIFSAPMFVMAQGAVSFTSVTVDIWPEYDQPAVLVIERVNLPVETTLPATLTLRIPSGGQINAVAMIDASGHLVNAPYESSVDGDWANLSITSNSLNVQVEYYQALVKDGNSRHITYQWPGDGSVGNFQVNFLAPANSSGITLDPPAESNAPGQDGLMNYVIKSQNLAADQTFAVKIDYNRPTSELSIVNQPVQAVNVPNEDTPGRVSFTVQWAWILGAIGVLLVSGGVYGFFRWKRAEQFSFPVRRNRHGTTSDVAEDVYCHECGKRAQPGDVFCRTCGARLKQS